MPIMHEDLLAASAELYDSFPRYKMSDYNTRYSSGSIIPSIIVPSSKYSSTETEFSSDDFEESSGGYGYSNGNGSRDNVGRITMSGFSTSASSSGSAKRRRRRKRKGGTSSSGSVGGGGGLTSSLTLSIRSNMSGLSQRSNLSSLGRGDPDRRRNSPVPALNSINDLKHAIGRHRGISGSFTPAIDSTLFAMFYATDIFDGILKEELSLLPMKYDSSNSYSVRKGVTSILRKEIVYSLRTSYFCPASKIVKLAQLLEEYFPLEQIHEPASFLDLLLSKILSVCHPPFLSYSNGSTKYVHRLPLEEHPHLKRSYSQPAVLTIQELLDRHLGGQHSPRKYGGVGGGNDGNLKFAKVPYPALILQVDRKCPTRDGDGDNHPGWTSRPNFPVIPNMEVDLTGLISKTSGGSSSSTWNVSRQEDNDQRFYHSFNESLTSYYPLSSENSFSGEVDVARRGGHVGVAVESRLSKGLKSAWKIMFRYLENFSSSSSDFTAHHPEGPSNLINGGSNNYAGTTTNSPFSLENNDRYNSASNSHDRINHPSSSSLPSTPFQRFSDHAKSELEGSYTLSPNAPNQRRRKQQQQLPQLKMELIAIVCYAGGGGGGDRMGQLNGKIGSATSNSPYYVYCKAGNDSKRRHDNGVNGYMNTEEFAPWIVYQSRYGVAPQVTLIENFGKWISSLERNHEEFSLYEVPLEIRRVLENSDLLIYKRGAE